jgi:hypothetical protein
MTRAGVFAAVAIATTGCTPAASTPPRAAIVEATPVKRSPNRPPKALCRHELEALGDEYARGEILDEPPAHAADLAKKTRPMPLRKVVVVNRLPPSFVVEGIVLPSSSERVRIDGSPTGAIAEIDGRGARGPIAVLLRRKLTGGLYDYLGDCRIVRNELEVLPWNPRVPLPKKVDDIRVVLEMIDNRPTVRLEGVPLGEEIRPTDMILRF